MKKKVFVFSLIIILVLVLVLILLNCNKESKVKYVFLFIGDGMSSAQVELLEIYEESIEKKEELLSFSNFNNIGFRKNKSKNSYITDSAAAATVLASGTLTYNGAINMTINKEKLIPITYNFHDNGMKIGIVTNVPINHATPAAFYGFSENRDNYDILAYDLANSNFEYFAGDKFILNKVSNNEINTYLTNKGYTIINSRQELNNLVDCNKCVILNDYSYFSLDNKNALDLELYVKKGIELLDNEDGFFMMIESGKIDGAMHNNDAKSAIYEVKELDKAIKVAIDFANKHKDETLIIVTGDHETGGLSLGNNTLSYTIDLNSIEKQKYSFEVLKNDLNAAISSNTSYDEILNYLNFNYGINDSFDLDKIYNAYLSKNTDKVCKEVLLQINNKAGIAFTTYNHTADRIPVYAYGALSDRFNGVYDSEEFNNRLRKIFDN